MLSVAKYRNAKTQHGDYRSVDEENIVVLRFCHSPVPGEGESTSTEEDGTIVEKEVVWFDFDFPEKVCTYLFLFLIYLLHIHKCIIVFANFSNQFNF